jgi:hypothetical protein
VSSRPSPTGTMVPTVPMVPRTPKTSLDGLMPRPEVRKTGLRFLWQAPAPWGGTICLDGPGGGEDLSLRPRAPPRAPRSGFPPSAVAPARPIGTTRGDGPDPAGETSNASADVVLGGMSRGDPRLVRLWFARAFGSTGCGPRPAPTSPVVCRARRRRHRRAVVTVVVPLARREPLFGPLRNPERNVRRLLDHGNNCWRCSRVFFGLRFDQRTLP